MAITTTRYSNADGVPLTQKVGATASVLLPDPQGNVIGRIDSTQAVVGKTWYWPYGELRTGTLGSSLGYGGTWGYYTDNTSNRIYIRARYLKPNYTKWLTVDPLWPEEDKYIYGASSPVSTIDPTGTQWLEPCNESQMAVCARQAAKRGAKSYKCTVISVLICQGVILGKAVCFYYGLGKKKPGEPPRPLPGKKLRPPPPSPLNCRVFCSLVCAFVSVKDSLDYEQCVHACVPFCEAGGQMLR